VRRRRSRRARGKSTRRGTHGVGERGMR